MGGGAEAGQVPDKLRYFMWNNQTSDPAGHPDYKYTLQLNFENYILIH